MATKIQLRRDTSSSWSSVNPVLSQGEPGIESNTGMMKLGNGTSAWNCLPYLVTCGSQGVTWENLGNKNNSCGPESIALGREAGFTGQCCHGAVAIGAYAGFQNQCYGSVAIGVCAGRNGQCENSVAIGSYAASNLQSYGSTAIGCSAGYTRQGAHSVAVGHSAASGRCQFQEYVDNCGSQLVLNSTCGVFAGMRVIGCGFDTGQRVNNVINCTTVELTAPPCSTPAGNLQFLSNQGYYAVAIGAYAGEQSQGYAAIAIGLCAGVNWQGCRGIAIGVCAGAIQQLADGIAIGTCAGYCHQGSSSVAIGYSAGKTHQGNVSVAVGHLAGFSGQVDNSIAINATACQLNPANSGLYIDPVRSCVCNVADTVYYNTSTKELTYGPSSGLPTWSSIQDKNNVCGPTQIAIGQCAGNVSPGCYSVAIGAGAGVISCYGAVAIGAGAQYNSPCAEYSTAIGLCAGHIGQCYDAVAVGSCAGYRNQCSCTVAVGASAGQSYQGQCAVAVGSNAGVGYQSCRTLGSVCGVNIQVSCSDFITAGMKVTGNGITYGTTVTQVLGCNILTLSIAPNCQAIPSENLTFTGGQGARAIAVGKYAGGYVQSACAVAVGSCAGYQNQGMSAIAIGSGAGHTFQGGNAIAIGAGAGNVCQPACSIIINASGAVLNGANQGLYVNPVRGCGSATSNTVYYNTITKEVTHGPSGSGGLIIPTPVQCAVGTPTVTITCTAGDGPDHATVSISVVSYAPVISAGVVITAGACVATPVVAGTSSTGCQTVTIVVPGSSAPFTAYAYVQTPFTTVFSAPVSGTSGVCFLKGTMIALSDGTYKAIEDITYDDLLLVWDFDLGRYAEARPVWIKAVETEDKYNLLTFSDGSTLRTIGNHHIFNKEAKRFTHTMRDDTPIGTKTVNEHGCEITLVSAEEIHETCESYNVFTEYHLNMYADGILTSNRFNNTYPIENMQFVKDDRELRSVSEFTGIDQRWIDGLRLREQTVEHSAEYIRWYMQRLEHYDVHSVVYQ